MAAVDENNASEILADRLFAATIGAAELQAVYLGDRLGWYRALADHGPLTSTELADRTATVERYAREWLEHQAVSGYLDVSADSDRRYSLSAEHAAVLLDCDSLLYLTPLSRLFVATTTSMPRLLDAYRHGGGVTWESMGADAREGQALMNRPMYLRQLCQEFLPTIADLHATLTGGAKVADLGMGEGWSSVALALGYPNVEVHGFDVDAASVAAARRHARDNGVDDRVHFSLVDVAGQAHELGRADTGTYDAVFAFECVHDVPDPVGFLSTARSIAQPGAPVIVVDERTADTFDPEAGKVEQLLYGFSLTCCLPDSLAHPGSVGTGTVMRRSTLESYALAAGFERVDVLPIEHEFLRFYRLG
ncbi:class I SAM-dependent methyltransferase [Rhodococcus sp. IEGM 1379]|uniref:methyltransferase domain-containing protein n=1 Tax=Rhodococcus sp. IEGM 1379 TaxID=3047086 RepID=UPI0024B80F85|nr:class I SAM-dependent methyltransferase [Rhodococcus sp. IEGM 1379]MDI9916123.1 class I SAM-dependent methyltransferase [Rhodococcus sp. IEGM 1379]